MRIKVMMMIALFCSLLTSAQFLHPGLLNTEADFNRAKSKIQSKAEPWTSAYDLLLTSKHVNLGWTPSPVAKLIRGGKTIWEPDADNYWLAYNDAATAYQCALVWKITGDTRYADLVVRILNAWAKVCKKVSGDSNSCLATGIYGYEFANAGELLRDYKGWSAEDFSRFKKWMLDVFCYRAFGFLENRNGTPDDHYWSNWGLCNALCAMSIGVLCDDVYTYNAGMEYYKYKEDHRYAESIQNLVWTLFKDPRGPFGYLGQMQESNRDQGHASMAAALASDICAVGTNQGEDLFAFKDDRIAAGWEYVAAYNSGVDDLPNSPYTNSDGTYDSIGYGSRGSLRPNWPRIVNYYENVRGVKMQYSEAMMNRYSKGGDAGGGFYGTASGGYDHLGFTTLMCSLDPLTDKTKVPTILFPKIVYGDITVERSGVNCIPKGLTVQMCVSLPNDETDTGKWSWDDDPTCSSPIHNVVLNTSGVYRAHYINSKGVTCTQLFTLHVEGEGTIAPTEPYCNMNGIITADTMIYVKKYGTVEFGLNYNGFSIRQWLWEKSTDGNSWLKLSNSENHLELSNISTNAFYRVSLTNKAGVKVVKTFRVEVAEIDPNIISDTDTLPTTYLAVPKGSKVKLFASPNTVLSKAVTMKRIYQWSKDNNILKRDTLTFHYAPDGITKVADLNDTLTFEQTDTCSNIQLDFHRISTSGTVSDHTIFNFSIPVYTKNDITPDYYYIIDPLTGNYLNNTDVTFTSYNSENDDAFQWRLRQMDSSRDFRYLILNKLSTKHLDETGGYASTTNYNTHTFDIFHKIGDDNLYAIRNSDKADALFWTIYNGTLSKNLHYCNCFPFQLVKVGNINTNINKTLYDNCQEGQQSPIIWSQHDRTFNINTATKGIIMFYDINGLLKAKYHCDEGFHTISVNAPISGFSIMTFISTGGKQKTFKILLPEK